MNVPSWISSLRTSSIAADMSAADVNGVVSGAGLAELLKDVASTLSSSGLTAAEFSDLRTIAANLNNGLSSSGYLTYAFNALVNGNAANAIWMGGAASSVKLGNLAIGASATQLTELTGKWFLGADLPSSANYTSNTPPAYSNVASPLFGASGPVMADINQGELSDCWLLASCAEIASQDPSTIPSMFTDNGNGTYGVRLYVNGVAQYVSVNTALPGGGTVFNSGTNIWASLLEKAYAELQTTGPDTGNTVNFGNAYKSIDNGGWPDNALEALTGCSTITDFTGVNGHWTAITQNASLVTTNSTTVLSNAALQQILASDIAAHDDVVVNSVKDEVDSSNKTTMIADHAMSVYGIDAVTGNLEIRNPWGVQVGQYWDTTFEISLSTLLADGDTFSVDNAGTSAANLTQNMMIGAVTETGAYVSSNIDALNASTGITSITLTDSGVPSVTMTQAQAKTDAAATNKIANHLYELIVGGAATYYAGGNGISGTSLQVSASSATIDLQANSRMDASATNDVVTAGAASNFSVCGAGGNTISAATGDGVWIGGNGANGADNVIHGSSFSAYLLTNARMDVVGANNTISAQASSNLGVWGGGDTISAAAGNGVWIGGNGANGSDNVIRGSGTNAYLQTNARMDVIGSNNAVSVQATSNLGIWGGGDTITAATGDGIWVGGNGGTNANDVVYGSSDSLWLSSSSRMDAVGSNNTITSDVSSAIGVWGGGDTVNAAANDGIWLGGNGVNGPSNVVVAALNDAIYDNATHSIIQIGANVGALTIQGTDTSGIVDLLNGFGGYSSAAAAFSALASDGHGGSLLSLGANGSIDFLGTTPQSLTAANFKIG